MAKKKTAAAKKRAAAESSTPNASRSEEEQQQANGLANGKEEHDVNGDVPMENEARAAGSSDPSTSTAFTFEMDLDGLTPSQRAESRKAEGNAKFKAASYGSAIDLYSEAIQLDPEEPSYLTNRAAAYMALKQYTPALADCQKAASLQSVSPQAKTLARLVRCQIALGQIDDASRTLNEVLNLEPSNSQAVTDQNRIEKIRGDLSNISRHKAKKEWTYVMFGLDSIEKEVEQMPLAWRITRVEALLGKKKVEDASMLASDLLRANPSDPDVLCVRGQVLFAQGATAQAIAHAQAALRNDPDHSEAKLLLKKAKLLDSTKEAGNDFFKKGQHQEAISKYTECLDLLGPENEALRITLLSNRATAYQKAGNHDAAVADCDTILQSQPKHFKALRSRARAYFALEKYEAAIADFAAAFQEAPAGTAEERAMKVEHRQAEVALKRSKTKDYYKILGVQKDASESEIKKAYRKQSLTHHPDKGGTEEKFKEVSEAYATLSDPQKKRRYDLGEDDDDGMSSGGFHSHHPFAQGGFGGGGFGGGADFGGGINLEDLLGGGRRRGGFGF